MIPQPAEIETLYWKEFFEDNGMKIEKADYSRSTDAHGEAFTTITSSGVKPDGCYPSALFATRDLAWKEFENQFLVWLKGRRRLHIRREPTLQLEVLTREEGFGNTIQLKWYWISCRLSAY